jgi:hypothetical protein
MRRRLSMIPIAVLLIACLVALPACKKKKPADDEGDPNAGPNTGPGAGPGPGVPPATSSDHLLFFQLNAKAVRDSSLFSDIKQAFVQNGAGDEWDKKEAESVQELGFSAFDVTSVTACVSEFSFKEPPKYVVILTTAKPINKANVFGYKLPTTPDSRGLYPHNTQQFTPKGPVEKLESYVHFPDDKTVALIHPDVVQKYLDGYAKNRNGWPMSADLSRAASANTMYLAVNFQKMPQLPPELRGDPQAQEFSSLLAAQTLTLTGNLRGKEIALAGRATFPDASAAGKAKDSVQKLVGMAMTAVEGALDGKGPLGAELASTSAGKPVVQEAHRTLKDAKIEVSGSDVTLAASYKADFDFNKLVAELLKEERENTPKLIAKNNLMQIGLALINFGDANNGRIPIFGVGPKGQVLANAKANTYLSWRVAILPYVEQQALYNEFKLDEPWDSAHNKKLIEKMPKLYAPAGNPGKPGYTHYQMVVGPGAMPYPSVTYPRSFTDGTSNTIAVLEAANPVIWTKPDDVVVTAKDDFKVVRKKFGGQFPGGFHTVLWDGTVRFIPDTMSDRTLQLAINPTDGQNMPAEWNATIGPKR